MDAFGDREEALAAQQARERVEQHHARMRALAEEVCLCADQQPAPIVGEAGLVHFGLGDRDAPR